MSTPSPTSLDSDLISPYAPKWAQEQVLAAAQEQAAAMTINDELEKELPRGIETEHDAQILDEIEISLREMIAASSGGRQPPQDTSPRLAEVSRIAAEHIAEERQAQAPVEAGVAPAAQPQGHLYRVDDLVKDPAQGDERMPPWLAPPHAAEANSPADEPWSRRANANVKKRNPAASLLVRFGLAAAGAAVLATFVVQGIPTLVYESLRTSLAELSSNAAAVFNEGKASPLQTRMDTVTKEPESKPAPVRLAAAGPVPLDQRTAAKNGNITVPSPEPRKEAAAPTSWPTPPEATPRNEPAIWHGPAGRGEAAPESVAAPAPAPTPAPAQRALTAEEIAMLRKQGDDYIAVGDFVGARVVLERAANAGDASAALALAATYDPAVLARFKVRGLQPDVAKAGFWYERARALGSSEAPKRLQTLAAGN